MATYIDPYKLFIGAITPNWLMERTEITSTAKLVYARLCQHWGANQRCIVRIDTIAKEVGVSKSMAEKSLAELKRYKLIEAVQQGFTRPNQYRFLDHEWISKCRNIDPDLVVHDTQPSEGHDTQPSTYHDTQPSTYTKRINRRESVKEIKNAPAAPPVDPSKQLNPEIKEIADRLFKGNPVKFKRLIAWIKKAEKDNVAPAVVAALAKFEPYSAEIDDWWPYLDKLLDKASKDYNRDQFELEHNKLKSQGIGKAGDILRQLGLASFGNMA